MMKNNGGSSWLIISYFVNESGMACSHHIDDRLLQFGEKGVDVTLLSTICVSRIDGIHHLRAPSLSPSGIRFEVRQLLKRKKASRLAFKIWETILLLPVYPFYFLEKIVINIDTTWFWLPCALIRGYLHCKSKKPEMIYSTGGPVSAHIVAGILAKLTGIRWIAEFQDPLIHSYCSKNKVELRLLQWAERYICASSDKVVFLTRGALARCSERTGLCDSSVVIYPGAEQQLQFENIYHRCDLLRFVHFGSLMGSRNLGCFLSALEELFVERPELIDIVRLSLYGSIENNVRDQIDRFRFTNTVEVHGLISRRDTFLKMRGSDVLLLIQNMDEISSETIPSKFYEYLHARRPILGLIYRNDELTDMLNRLGHLPVDSCDIGSIKKGILNFVDSWYANGLCQSITPSPFTPESAAAKLIALA